MRGPTRPASEAPARAAVAARARRSEGGVAQRLPTRDQFFVRSKLPEVL